MENPTRTSLLWAPRAARARNGAGLQRGFRFLGCKCLLAAWILLGMRARKRGRPPWRLKSSPPSCIKPRRWGLLGRCWHTRVGGGGHGPVREISAPPGIVSGIGRRFPTSQIWEGFDSERIASSAGAPCCMQGRQNSTGSGPSGGG